MLLLLYMYINLLLYNFISVYIRLFTLRGIIV